MEIEMEKLPRKASEAKKVQRHSGKSHARWGSNVRVSMYSSKEKQMIVEAERNNRRLKTEYKMRIATAFALVLFSLWMYILLNADVSQRYGFNQFLGGEVVTIGNGFLHLLLGHLLLGWLRRVAGGEVLASLLSLGFVVCLDSWIDLLPALPNLLHGEFDRGSFGAFVHRKEQVSVQRALDATGGRLLLHHLLACVLGSFASGGLALLNDLLRASHLAEVAQSVTRSEKPSAITAFWCPVYSRVSSPVKADHSLTNWSEDARKAMQMLTKRQLGRQRAGKVPLVLAAAAGQLTSSGDWVARRVTTSADGPVVALLVKVGVSFKVTKHNH
ncbi:hypothetical protein TYRP_001258 [Tyrophagus putrescentiae]|nr:hypothetical protein TYRP_001258 [Tyrophagus putrescentiae]